MKPIVGVMPLWDEEKDSIWMLPGYMDGITQAVFDFNGTLGTDGVLERGLAQKIEKLAEKVRIYVVSSDTYGSVAEQCRNLPVEVVVLPKGKGGEEKKRRVMEMGAEKTVCIGNEMRM